jgi:hypothetical protein
MPDHRNDEEVNVRHVTFLLHNRLLHVRWSVFEYAHGLGSSSALDLMVGSTSILDRAMTVIHLEGKRNME